MNQVIASDYLRERAVVLPQDYCLAMAPDWAAVAPAGWGLRHCAIVRALHRRHAGFYVDRRLVGVSGSPCFQRRDCEKEYVRVDIRFGPDCPQMVNPGKVLAFLDVAVIWDHSLALAMLNALLTLGAEIFGVGWSLSGIHPGPATVGLTTGLPAPCLSHLGYSDYCIAENEQGLRIPVGRH